MFITALNAICAKALFQKHGHCKTTMLAAIKTENLPQLNSDDDGGVRLSRFLHNRLGNCEMNYSLR